MRIDGEENTCKCLDGQHNIGIINLSQWTIRIPSTNDLIACINPEAANLTVTQRSYFTRSLS